MQENISTAFLRNNNNILSLPKSKKHETNGWPLEYLGKLGYGNSEQPEFSEEHA